MPLNTLCVVIGEDVVLVMCTLHIHVHSNLIQNRIHKRERKVVDYDLTRREMEVSLPHKCNVNLCIS